MNRSIRNTSVRDYRESFPQTAYSASLINLTCGIVDINPKYWPVVLCSILHLVVVQVSCSSNTSGVSSKTDRLGYHS